MRTELRTSHANPYISKKRRPTSYTRSSQFLLKNSTGMSQGPIRRNASFKMIVTSPMEFDGRESIERTNSVTWQKSMEVYLKYQCPRPDCSKSLVKFRGGTGCKNLYSHLRSCYGRGKSLAEQNSILEKLYESALQATRIRGGTILSHFTSSSLSDYDKGNMAGYVKLFCATHFSDMSKMRKNGNGFVMTYKYLWRLLWMQFSILSRY